MKRSPRNFVLLSVLNFVLWSIVAVVTAPVVHAALSPEDSWVAIGLSVAVIVFGAAGGLAIARTGSAAISALTEKPEVFRVCVIL